jgi:hypothetical protein
MRVNSIAVFTLAAAAAVAAGCHSRTLDQSEFRYALDDYYRAQPHCLWSSPVNFPTEPDKGNPEQARQLKALTDAGLLERRSGELGGAMVTEYSLSALGKTQWSADAKEPGWGNFCFARAEVTSIDSINPPTPASVAYTIAYHYGADVPAWAKTSAVQAAFPNIAAEASGAATATLARAGTEWQVQNVRAAGSGGN